MTVFRMLTPRLRFTLAVFLINYAVFLVFRGVFAAIFYHTGGTHALGDVLHGLYLGAKFDMRLALWIILPILLISWVPGINVVRSRVARYIWLGYLVLGNLTYTLFYMVDFGHYAYLGERLNSSVVRLLAAPDIAFTVAWESYPVVWTSLGMIAFAAAIGWLQWRFAFPLLDWKGWIHPRWRRYAMGTGCFFLVIFGMYGQFSWYPLRWSQAFFVADPYVDALGLNPMLYFLETYENQSLGYNEKAVRAHYPEVAAYLGVDHPDAATLNFTREFHPKGITGGKRYNVVLIHMESLATRFCGVYGNGAKPTPYFDDIANHGLLFTNMYVPSPGTARSVFAALTGLPDVMGAGSTATRNPELVYQHVLLNDLKGYKRFYFLGGSANWGNIRGLLSHNIEGIDIHEEGSYTESRADGWGISDYDLFTEANKSFAKQGDQPFAAMIQTAGNHRPYTIPEHHGDFKLEHRDEDTLRRFGFESLDEFNSLRFMDYSLGHFMELARKEPYFKHTIFMIYGDHGIPGTGQHLTPGEIKLNLTSYHNAFAIYSPSLFPEGKVITKMANEMDMLPTIMGMLGEPYTYTAMGRDLFDPRFDKDRYTFTALMDSPPIIGLMDEQYLMRMDKARGAHLYDYRSSDPNVPDLKDKDPERLARMQELAEGLWQTSRYLLSHNRAGQATNAAAQPAAASGN
ncbi:MAG TPA: LTA synthase family protein [bacterium]|nr:LTA synthase family protein [bacterium]